MTEDEKEKIKEEAYREGYNRGHDDGYEEGFDKGYFEGHEDGFSVGQIKHEEKFCMNCKYFVEDREPGKIFMTGNCMSDDSSLEEVKKTDEACDKFENMFNL